MVESASLPNRKVLEFPITALPFEEQVKTIVRWASDRQSRTVCVANVHMLMEAYWSPDFGTVLKNADLVTPDGMPLVWMMRRLGAISQERVAGFDLFMGACELAQKLEVSLFFVGSQREILSRMRERLKREFPQLKIAAMEPLPFRPLTEAEDKALIKKINESGAGLVFVSLGCPKQEKWMAQHKDRINAVMVGLGGVFPVYAGIQRRAPRLMRSLGFEWFYRLLQEPRRLYRRYAITIPPFIWLACKQLMMSNSFNTPFNGREKYLGSRLD